MQKRGKAEIQGMRISGWWLTTGCAVFFNPKGDTASDCSKLQFLARLRGPRLLQREAGLSAMGLESEGGFLAEVHAGIIVYCAGAQGRGNTETADWQPSLFAVP